MACLIEGGVMPAVAANDRAALASRRSVRRKPRLSGDEPVKRCAPGSRSTARSRPSDYRRYAAGVVAELGFIKTAQEIGFTLAEIRAVLEAQRSASLNCLQGAGLVDAKLVEIGRRLARLRTMRSDLEAMRSDLVTSALDQGLDVPDRLRRHRREQVRDAPHVSES
jgi:DNA-binding transcriptional MerR regulator